MTKQILPQTEATNNPTYLTLENLITFQHEATRADFITIFGEAIGNHLWAKFSHNYDLLGLYAGLDSHNRRRFAQYFEGVTNERQ